MIWGLILSRGKSLSSSTKCPDRLLGPPILLFSGYQGLMYPGGNGWTMKLTGHVHLVLRFRLNGATPPTPLYILTWYAEG